ncbi:sarcosine oxidase subunit delta [Aquibium microcysteis]|uniref:sarcosine oxidase subunit delta n=1 Tax=Aquibium microcysteis TaxID=675281 RepID=UPI00165D19B9|nr:sarcosine oxidase subunit delta [Aquibium microcysteis]
MLITCPCCGPRDVSEFTYQGDANRTRPDPASTDQAAWNAYVYDRVNTAGAHREYWQHSGGCRSHLIVVRSTLTHRIDSVRFARDAADGARRRSGGAA